MTDKQQNLDSVQLQQLMMAFLNANPQEAQRIIEAKQEILLSDEIIMALRKQIELFQQKLSLLESVQKDYAHKQAKSNNTSQQPQEKFPHEISSDKIADVRAAESYGVAQG